MDAYKNLYLRTSEGIKPSLEIVKVILEELNNPHLDFAVVHVAGTNGKGSVCCIVESVLRASGLRTGLFTSPHLINFSERYRINGRAVTKNKLNRLIISTENLADEICHKRNLRKATFFEISTIIAFLYFSEEKIDIAVIETGMGGRWDATNVVYPLISIITSIGMDHMNFLGNSLSKIAREKAGIIKKGRPVVSSPQLDEVKKILISSRNNIIFSNEVVSYTKNSDKVKFESMSQNLPPVKFPLIGEYQYENAALAVSALEIISNILKINLKFKEGLEQVKWPGRFMKIYDKPLVIFDGAHNPDAAKRLVKTIQQAYPQYKLYFILGFLDDKDILNFSKQIAPIAEHICTVSINTYRGKSAKESASIINNLGIVSYSDSLNNAWKKALKWAEKDQKKMIIITGSLRLGELFVNEDIFPESKFTS